MPQYGLPNDTTSTGVISPGPGANTTIIAFATPSATWVVTHNLDAYPSVTVVDSGGTVVVGDVVYNSSMQLTITFAAGFSGTVYLN